MKLEKVRIRIILLASCLVLSTLVSCGPKERIAVSQLDTPGHHTYTGLKLLELEKYSDARREFKMATQLDSKYSKAYAGMALVNICTGKLLAASNNMEEASRNAQTNDEKLFVHVVNIRYHTSDKSDPHWLEMAKKDFKEAVLIDPKHAPVYYYMGLAYKDGLEFGEAARMFDTVLKLKTDHIDDANNQIKFLQKVQRANPTTDAGKRISLTENLTRAETAALFMQELKIKDLYNQYAPKVQDVPVKETGQASPEGKEAGPVDETKVTGQVFTETYPAEPPPMKLWANDILEHPLYEDIEGVLESGVHGLENDPRGNFKPNEVISRGEFAIIVEDVLIKVTGEKDIAARYVNAKSLFPDVPADMPYFKAIIAVTSKGIMEAKNIKTGEFSPLKPLSGVEALLAIRKLKDVLKIN